jgi:hypothetical protein
MRAIFVGFALLLLMPHAMAADNSGSSSQSGSAQSGDAVGGPSVSVARAGNVRVVATNVSDAGAAPEHSVSVLPGDVVSTNVQGPSSATSGDASGSNRAVSFVGVAAASSTLVDVIADVLR